MVRRIRGLGMEVRLPIPFAAVEFAVLCKLLAVMCQWECVLEMVWRMRGLGMEVRLAVVSRPSLCAALKLFLQGSCRGWQMARAKQLQAQHSSPSC
jgi:hypothetical protein